MGVKSVLQRNLFALHQRIADQPVPVKVFPVHIDGSDLVVAVGRVVVNASVSVAAACVERDLVLAAVQLTAAALLLDSVQDVEELPDALGLAAAGFRVHPHKGRTHKAGLAGQIARQAQCAEAAAVDGQVKAVRKRNRRRARRECAVVVQCEKLLRERRIVRQYTDGVIVDVQAVGSGLHHDAPRFVGNEPVQLREGQLLTERDIDDVGFCKQRAHLGQRRTAAQQPGDQLKLSDVAFAILRRVVDCIADKVQPCDAQALLIDGVIVERVLPRHVGHADHRIFCAEVPHAAQAKRVGPRRDGDLVTVGKFIIEIAAKVETVGCIGCSCTHGKHPFNYNRCSAAFLRRECKGGHGSPAAHSGRRKVHGSMVSIGPCIFSVVYIVPHPARDNPPPNCKQCVLAESNAITKKLATYKNLPVTEVKLPGEGENKNAANPEKRLAAVLSGVPERI